jgi:hypothetical protein
MDTLADAAAAAAALDAIGPTESKLNSAAAALRATEQSSFAEQLFTAEEREARYQDWACAEVDANHAIQLASNALFELLKRAPPATRGPVLATLLDAADVFGVPHDSPTTCNCTLCNDVPSYVRSSPVDTRDKWVADY